MNTKQKVMMILKRERPLIDVWYYIQGNIRSKIYYHKRKWIRKWLMRRHIREQIDFRIKVMNPVCFEQGSCLHCGCETTKLQMANKACEGACYFHMASKKKWNDIKNIVYDYYTIKNDI